MHKTKWLRGAITVGFVLAALLLVYLVVAQTMPELVPILRTGDEQALEAYLRRDVSASGILTMALLQMVQVWSLVISGVIVNVAAGVVFGLWRAFVICQLSSTFAHSVSFMLCQRLEQSLDRFLPDSKGGKLDSLSRTEHPAYLVVTLSFVPFIPNGLISIAASRTRLKPWEFSIAMFCGSAFGTFVYCWLGSSLLQGQWLTSALLIALMLLVALLMWKYQKQILHLLEGYLKKRKTKASH